MGSGSDHELSRATVDEGWKRGREHVRDFNAIIDGLKPLELGMDVTVYDLDASKLNHQMVEERVQ